MYNVYANGNLIGLVNGINDTDAVVNARLVYGLNDYDYVTVTAVGPRKNSF